MRNLKLSIICATAAVFCVGAAHASIGDPDIQAARECTQYFAKHERLNGIPSHLLAAISATESGRYNKQLKMVLPWPWTINAEGKGHYFNTKAEAIRKVREYQAQGVKSIDIGCMQVNLKHHPTAFASLEQAFDPKYNVAYAAKFLKSNFDDAGSWNKAIQYYHSRTPKYGMKYLQHIQKSWNAISGKIRMAIAETDSDEQTRPRKSYRVVEVKDADGSNSSGEIQISSLAPRKSLSLSRSGANEGKPMMRIKDVDRLSGFKQRTIKDIKVSTRSNENNVMVIRAHKPQPVKLEAKTTPASATTAQDMFVTDAPASGKKAAATAQNAKSGSQSRRIEPKFVFVD